MRLSSDCKWRFCREPARAFKQWSNDAAFEFKNGVADGTRTRNSQNHNLELYH